MSEISDRWAAVGSGKQPLDQLLASGAAHLRCYAPSPVPCSASGNLPPLAPAPGAPSKAKALNRPSKLNSKYSTASLFFSPESPKTPTSTPASRPGNGEGNHPTCQLLVRLVRSLLRTAVLLRRSVMSGRPRKAQRRRCGDRKQLEKEVREYHERDKRQMGSGGKQETTA
jgi:hypothetical protein